MNELQLYRDIATGVLGILVLIIGYLYKSMADEMKAKLSKEEFKTYLEEASTSRKELREAIMKLFLNLENHEKLDAVRFDSVIKDFNGGVNRLSEKISEAQISIMTQLNGKADR